MKDKKILYGIIIAFIFLLSIGLTYAYFSVTTNVVGDRNDIRANAGVLSILYTDGPEIVGNNINPGWTETKVVKVKNTGTLKAYYTLMWDSLTNEITNDELVFSATCTSDIGTCNDLESTPVGADELAIGVGIEAGEEQTYTLTFEFIEISSAQNYNQGKAFNGVLRVEDSLQTFALTGMLLDENGNPVENAVVEVHSKVRTGITDENGIFGIAGVEVGNHELIVKNLSNEVIATDSITLAGGQSETISNKDIVADTNNAAINMKITLGEANNINTINTWNYEEICTINENSLGCKLFSSSVKILVNLAGGTLSQTFNESYNKNTTLIVENPYKEGYIFAGWTVSGKGATMENSELTIGRSNVNLTANYIDINSMYTYTGDSTIIDDGNGNWRIKFLTSGTFTPNFNMEIDAFLVGGGGGGGSGAGGGGGGGYTNTEYEISLENQTPYGITIGEGGTGGTINGNGYNGKSTTAFGYTVLGGYGGNGWSGSPMCIGGNGGSGGGGGTEYGNGGSGGSNGDNGNAGNWAAGTGQGASTKEFSLYDGKLYASGGGAGNNGVGSNGAGSGGNHVEGTSALANTGGGGGGAGSTGSSATYAGGNGGSGIVVIRNSRMSVVGLTKKYYFFYKGDYILENENTDNWAIKFLTSGTFTPKSNMTLNAFLVGGGGGGGDGVYYANNGGGGGGGGVLYATSQFITSGSYSIVIGNGGVRKTNGQNTTFNGLIAYGGGAGGSSSTIAKNGGSGGGAVPDSINKYSSYAGQGYTGQGYNGGEGATSNPWAGGGGGGASELGNTDGMGLGGDGITYSVAESSAIYGGGGSGGNDAARLAGGDGGGGTGAVYYDTYGGGNGIANTGGGGGGGASRTASEPGGTGGSGIIIISPN